MVALGIGADAIQHSLGVVEGATENATVVTHCSRGRGIDVSDDWQAVTRYDLNLWIGHPLEGAAYLAR